MTCKCEEKLFLVRFNLEYGEYPNERTPKIVSEIRLVRAVDSYYAEDKVKKEFERIDPYGLSIDVRDIEVLETIE
jgi:hypothetical protein